MAEQPPQRTFDSSSHESPYGPSYPPSESFPGSLPESLPLKAEKSFGRRFLGLLIEIVQTLLVAGLLFVGVNLITARIRVESVSMQPTLYEGEFVIVSRLAYFVGEPQRGDIIVFRFPLDPSRRYIKRVVGLAGDTIEVREGEVYVNGIRLHEPYIASPPRYDGEWHVAEGELFVLGDNRNNSLDSKNWGNLELEAVIGKAVVIYWPPEDVGMIPHPDLIGPSLTPGPSP